MLEQNNMRIGFIEVGAREREDGGVELVITSHSKGKIAKAKLGAIPLPLRLALKEGTKLSLTLSQD